jgi:hypothetical protein
MMFNINAYARLLVADCVANGGQIEIREFVSPAELSTLRQKTLINATGYGGGSVRRPINHPSAGTACAHGPASRRRLWPLL